MGGFKFDRRAVDPQRVPNVSFLIGQQQSGTSANGHRRTSEMVHLTPAGGGERKVCFQVPIRRKQTPLSRLGGPGSVLALCAAVQQAGPGLRCRAGGDEQQEVVASAPPPGVIEPTVWGQKHAVDV